VTHTLSVPQLFENQDFRLNSDRDAGRVFEDLEFHRCRFISGHLSAAQRPELRSTARRIRITDCEWYGAGIGSAILEDVVVDGLETHGLLQAWAAVFKHVTLRGKIGRIMLSNIAQGYLPANPEKERLFAEANAAYYRDVDWALDLSEGEFEEVDIRSVPAQLIRRDPRTQAVVRRDRALAGTWRALDLRDTWEAYLEGMFRRGSSEAILISPKRDRRFADYVRGIQLLRDAGIADPD
jgi:hypothetical protein